MKKPKNKPKISQNTVYMIDQSGKIEQTNKDTVLALSNGSQYTVLLKSADKRLLEEIFRKLLDRRRQYIYEVFAGLLYLLISNANVKTKVVLDNEYPGQEGLIKLLFLKFWEENQSKQPPELEYGHTGKTSNAHSIAYKTFKKKVKPNKVVEFDEISGVIFDNKK